MLQQLKQLGKESLIYGFSTVLVRLLTFLLMPFYTHYLLPGQYGIVATVFSYIAFFNIVYGWGLNHGYMRYFKKDGALASSFNVVLYSSLMLSILIGFSAIPLAKWASIGIENSDLIIYSALILFLDAVSLIPFADLRIKHQAKRFVVIRSFSIVVNVALNIVFIAYMDLSIKGIFYANICSSALSALMLKDYFPLVLKIMDKKLLKEIFAYSLPLLPAGFSIMIVQMVDKPMMMKLMDSYSVGIYQANYKLAIVISLLVTMFDQAWRPFVIERADGEHCGELFAAVFRYFSFFLLSVWLFFSLFINDIVSFEIFSKPIVNPAYYEGLKIVPIIMAAYFFNGIYVNFIAPVIIKKNTYIIMVVAVFAAALNIILNFILMKKYGIYGAAWSAFLSYFAMSVLIRLMTRKIYEIKYEYGKFLASVFIAVGLYLTYYFYSSNFSSCSTAALKTTLFLAFFPLAFIAKVFSKKELLEISDAIRKRIAKV